MGVSAYTKPFTEERMNTTVIQILRIMVFCCGGMLFAPQTSPSGAMPARNSWSISVRIWSRGSIVPLGPSPVTPPHEMVRKLVLEREFVSQAPWAVTYEVLRLRAQGGCLERYVTTSTGHVEFVPDAFLSDLYLSSVERRLLRETGKRQPLALFRLEQPELLDETPVVGHRELLRRLAVHTILPGRTIPFQEGMTDDFMVIRERITVVHPRHLARTIRAGVRPCEQVQSF